MVTKLDTEDFLVQSAGRLLIDVRSPAEYLHGHIPGALSFPLFSNEERSVIGTCYNQQGREAAMMLGLKYYGINMLQIVTSLKKETSDKQVFVHCWRGGMRSGVVSWMLDLFGYRVTVLNKGYKAFRKAVLESFSMPKNILILGGKTGSAKTEVLHELQSQGESVIDLEALAHHKGSAFGGINESEALTQEQFENELFMQFRTVGSQKTIWLEDESQRIGSINLPNALWMQMRNARVMYLDIPFEKRLSYLVDSYGSFPVTALKEATLRIAKRLGGLETKNAVKFLEDGEIRSAFSIFLKYYDKYYTSATQKRDPDLIHKIISEKINAGDNALLIRQSKNFY